MAGIRINGPVFTPLAVPDTSRSSTTPSAVDPEVSSYDGTSTRAAQAAALGTGDGSRPAWMNLLPPGWTPDQPIKLDPSKSFDVGYQKMIMAQTAVVSSVQQGKPLPTQAFMENAYKYWIPKFDTIGGKGLDSYWLGRLVQPPGDGGDDGTTSDLDGIDNTDIMDKISMILARPQPDSQKTDEIDRLLRQKSLPSATAPSK
jgi:hypothetical protein